MRIPSGTTDRYIYFVAVDATDLKTRETALSSFTVYRARNGATPAAMTTPTVNETDATNMPGVYALLLDEDTTLAAGNDTEEMCIDISHAGMASVTRVFEIYRPKATEGNSLDVTATGAAGIDWGNIENKTTTNALTNTSAASLTGSVGSVTGAVGSVTGSVGSVTGAVGSVTGSVGSVVGHTPQTGDTYALANGAAGFVAIHADTNELQTDWADGGRLDLILDAAGSAGDPWSTAIPGAYGAGTAGNILGNRLDATLTDRTLLAAAYFDASTNNVTLADGPHGGTSAVITAERVVVASTTLHQPAVKLTGAGMGAGLYVKGGDDGIGFEVVGGAIAGVAMSLYSPTTVALLATGNGGDPDIRADIDGSVGSVTGGINTAAGTITTLDALDTAQDTKHDATVTQGDTAWATATGFATAANLATVDSVVDAIKVITDALGATAAARLALSAGQIIPFTVDTATNSHTPTVTEFQADDITEATADHYNGRLIVWTSGVLAGQVTDVTDYAAVGGIGQFTCTGLTEAPSNNDTGILV